MALEPIDLAALNARVHQGAPAGRSIQAVSAERGRVVCHLPSAEDQLRLGGMVSGPTQMTLADAAAYALVLAISPGAAMAVTASLSVQFLAPVRSVGLRAEASLIHRAGNRIICDVRLLCAGSGIAASHAVVVYILPR